jgi:hypothetical protein
MSCGFEYCPNTNCQLKHPFNGGRRARCNDIKSCISRVCSPLTSLGDKGIILYDSCLGSCQTNPGTHQDYKEYLCSNFDATDLVFYYGVNPCGADPALLTPIAPPAAELFTNPGNNSKTLYIFGGVVVLVIAAILFFRR